MSENRSSYNIYDLPNDDLMPDIRRFGVIKFQIKSLWR